MTRKKDNAEEPDWQEWLRREEDFLRPLRREIVPPVLEADREEA